MSRTSRRIVTGIALVLLAFICAAVVVVPRPVSVDDAHDGGSVRQDVGDTDQPGGEREARPARQRPPSGAAEDGEAESRLGSETVARGGKVALPPTAPGRVGGVVLGPDGEPVADVRVWVSRAWKPEYLGEPAKVHEVRTDNGGAFVVDDLTEAEYSATFTAQGFVRARVDLKTGADAVKVVLEQKLPIAGTVVGAADGKPVAGANVAVFSSDARLAGAALQRRVTDEKGRFRFEDVPPGRFEVMVGSGRMHDTDDPDEFQEVRVRGVRAGKTDLTIEVAPGLRITGEIVDELGRAVLAPVEIHLTRLRDDGEPESGTRRQLWYVTGGKFAFGGLPPGAYDITIALYPDTADGEESDGAGDTDWAGAVTLSSVAAGTEGVVARMVRSAPITGRLVDEAGEPVTVGGWVNAFPAGGDPGMSGSVRQRIASSPELEISGLDAGRTYDLSFDGFAGHRGGRLRGVVPGQKDVTVVLERARWITGRVLDAEGRPVPPGTPVVAEAIDPDSPDAPRRSVGRQTRQDGAFAFESLGSFRYRIAAGGGGSIYAPDGSVSDVAAGTEGVEVRVKRGCELRGRLLDASGAPARTEHLIAIMRIGVPLSSSTRVDTDDGSFVLTGLLPGKATVLAMVDGRSVTLGQVTAPAEDLELRLPARADGDHPR